MTHPSSDLGRWREAVARIEAEWQSLDAGERAWATEQVEAIANLQQQMHRLTGGLRAEELCRKCAGECCAHGKFHPTLANIVACLAAGEPIPAPDFRDGCPYLGDSGCQFPPGLRPFNCIIFICDAIDGGLSAGSRRQLRRMEKQLRDLYAAFDERYAGSNLRGLLNHILPEQVDYLSRRN